MWTNHEEEAANYENSGIGRRFEGSLRLAVSAVDREMSALGTGVATSDDTAGTVRRLVSSWDELVRQLALGPAPDVRSCPVCGRVGMSAATLCGYCWAPLTPNARDRVAEE